MSPIRLKHWKIALRHARCLRKQDGLRLEFFEQLKGSEELAAMEFAKNMDRNQTEVKGLKLEVTEEVIAQLRELRAEGKRWFN